MLAAKRKPRREARSAARRSKSRASKSRTSKGKIRNRRVEGGSKAARERAPVDPEQRRVRNRTILALAILALVNAYVFVWNEDGLFSGLGSLEAASTSGRRGPLPPMADAPQTGCGGDPARIFEGLEGLIRLDARLGGGSTLRLELLALGVPADEIDRIEASVRSKVDLGLLGGSHAPLRIAADRSGGVHALELELAEGHVLQACRNDEGSYDVRNLQHPLRSDVEVIPLTLGRHADLASAVEEAGEKPELAAMVAGALAYDIDFLTEARPHDKIEVLVEKRWLGRRFHRYGSVLAVRFRGVARRVAYYRYKPEGGEAQFYDGDGRPMRRALLRSPVRFVAVDSEARGMLPPSLEVIEGRVGSVYRLPEGAPVVAVADGTIVAIEQTAKEGNYIDLELSDGRMIRYAHLMRFIGELEVGTELAAGNVIGLAGHSGRTPHDRLRLEIWDSEDGELRTTDPMILTAEAGARAPTVGDEIAKAELAGFESDTEPQRRALRAVRR